MTKTPKPSRDINALIEIMADLRTPVTGCPWDLKQDFKSIAPYTIEEAYEVADAIERDDMDDLRLELGDLLLQSIYHARMAEEAGHFDFGDVVEGITQKMIRRHPHVFGTEDVTRDEYSATGMENATWERIKAEEKQETAQRRAAAGLPPKNKGMSILDEVPAALPALAQAVKLQSKAAKVGFDWDDPKAVLTKLREELDEVEAELESGNLAALKGEIGDVLFVIANLARHAKIDPDAALRTTNQKFRKRFGYIEKHVETRTGKKISDASLDGMETLWQEAKSEIKS